MYMVSMNIGGYTAWISVEILTILRQILPKHAGIAKWLKKKNDDGVSMLN